MVKKRETSAINAFSDPGDDKNIVACEKDGKITKSGVKNTTFVIMDKKSCCEEEDK